MRRYLAVLLISTLAIVSPLSGMAQSSRDTPAQLILLRQQNPLIDAVARDNPDRLWALLSKLQSLMSNRGAPARAGTPPTADESAEIMENPAFDQAYKSDPGGTLALLRATNDALLRARKGTDMGYPRRVALVVGDNGGATWGKLSNADNDARLVSAKLKTLGFTLVTGGALIDPDRAQFREAIRDFGRSIGKETVALFYFAGHGIQYRGHNYLVPAHAILPTTEDDYDRLLVEVDDTVLHQLQEAKGQLSIIVLDACRNLPPVALPSLSVARGRPLMGMATPKVPPGMNGVVFFYSTAPGEVARDKVHNDDVNGPFATAFSKAIMRPGTELRDAFEQVQEDVKGATTDLQRPWLSFDATGKFFFSNNLLVKSDSSDLPLGGSRPEQHRPPLMQNNYSNYPLQPASRMFNKRCDTWAGQTFCE